MKTYVYLIWAKDTNLFKIGISADPQQRLNQLQTGCPHVLQLYAAIEDDMAEQTESRLHLSFKSSLVRGEWFSLTPNQIAEILGFFIQARSPLERWTEELAVSNAEKLAQKHFYLFLSAYKECHRKLLENHKNMVNAETDETLQQSAENLLDRLTADIDSLRNSHY